MDAGDTPDAGPLDLGAVDLGPPCATDDECDDGVACTRDVCDGRSVCVHTPDALRCDDGVFCNGAERCEPSFGCVAGPLRECGDDDVCTLDRCDEERQACVHIPRDFDGDGEADWHCAGGTDCDDSDPDRGALQAELCADSVDNDCDGLVDELECGRPLYDVCADALDVSAGGRFRLTMDGARDDYAAACAGPGRELVGRLVLSERSGLRITASGEVSAQVDLRQGCEASSLDIACDLGVPGEVRMGSLAAGEYFVFVAAGGSSGTEIDLDVEILPESVPPTNISCESAAPLVGSPVATSGSFVDAGDSLDLVCGESGAADLFYTLTVPGPDAADVVVALNSPEGATRFSLRSTCADASSELLCVRGSPAGARIRSVPPGDYALIIEGGAGREVDFMLDVRLEPPTSPPLGESCDAPIDTPLNTIVHGTLADKVDSLQTRCGFFYRDAVHRFVLTEASDVAIDLLAGERGGDFVLGGIASACGDPFGDSGVCVGGTPALIEVPNLPAGEHFLVIEAPGSPTYQVEVRTSEPTPVIDVTGNDNCGDAWPIALPPAPGQRFVYRGTTEGFANDVTYPWCGSGTASSDATFVIDLEEATDVRFSTAGSDFDTVLMVYSMSSMCTGFPLTCNDDSGPGSSSVIERTLGPGILYIVVDGFGQHSDGRYLLSVERGPFPDDP